MADDSLIRGASVDDVTRAVADRVVERLARADQERILLEAIVQNIPAGLVAVDQAGTPVVVNGEALRMFGKESVEDLAKAADPEAYSRDGRHLQPDERPIARTLRGDIVSGETYEVVVDGRQMLLEVSTAPLVSDAGEPQGALAIFRDVTARQRAERAERDFVTNAAHELQSPLAAIVSAVEVLQAGAKDGLERDVFLGHIEREADRLARLVRALLILARTQIGMEAPRNELVALCPLLGEVGASLRVDAGVELEIDCGEELAVLTNRELVEQAVVNLAENAAKNTSAGRVVLGARQLDGGAVEISVTDTGQGIEATERSRVFDRFYRGREDGAAGFGLGLAIVRAVAEALEGELELDSEIGVGTVFRLRLPHGASMVTA
jgi:two-component system, OmpR family, phosphate regulon sensor histidine kinase PhoR